MILTSFFFKFLWEKEKNWWWNIPDRQKAGLGQFMRRKKTTNRWWEFHHRKKHRIGFRSPSSGKKKSDYIQVLTMMSLRSQNFFLRRTTLWKTQEAELRQMVFKFIKWNKFFDFEVNPSILDIIIYEAFKVGDVTNGTTDGLELTVVRLENQRSILLVDLQGGNDKRSGEQWKFRYFSLLYILFLISDIHFFL